MCDTTMHRANDEKLVGLPPEALRDPSVFEQVRRHRYNDECCQIELRGDGQVQWKQGCGPVIDDVKQQLEHYRAAELRFGEGRETSDVRTDVV